jgi:hypothetical protein
MGGGMRGCTFYKYMYRLKDKEEKKKQLSTKMNAGLLLCTCTVLQCPSAKKVQYISMDLWSMLSTLYVIY